MLAKEFNSHADDSEEEGEEADVQSRGEAEGREEDEEEVALPIEASGEAAANRSQGPKAMRPTPTHRRGSAGFLIRRLRRFPANRAPASVFPQASRQQAL